MSDKVKIAIDAMGGDNAPKKVIKGIEISLKYNKNNFFYLFGDEILLSKEISLFDFLKYIFSCNKYSCYP